MNSPATSPEATAPTAAPPCYTYHCRRCRMFLFRDRHRLLHDPVEGSGKHFKYHRPGPLEISSSSPSSLPSCSGYFLDPDQSPWVALESREAVAVGAEVEPDTIYCPNPQCHAKLGTQSWTGSQCSCGAWVTPAFRIQAKAVDRFVAAEP